MKKVLFIVFASLSIVACKKDDSTSSSSGPAAGDCTKFPYRKGSSVTMSSAGTSPVTTNYSKDTTIAGQYYVGSTVTSTGGITVTAYTGLNSAKEVLMTLPAVGDLPANTMAVYKLNATVGTTWNYTFPSKSMPSMMSYKYIYTILSNSETFSFGGTNYTGGQKVKLELQMITSGTAMTMSTTYGTYCCGIGGVYSNDGTTTRTLSAYTY